MTAPRPCVQLVDLQPQYVFSVHTINAVVLINNATGLAKAAKAFAVPTVHEMPRPAEPAWLASTW